MKTEHEHIMHHYLGCQVVDLNGNHGTLRGIKTGLFLTDCKTSMGKWSNARNFKLVLRQLSDMTDEEADHFAWLCVNNDQYLSDEEAIIMEEITTEIRLNDGGLMLDGDVFLYIEVWVRCFGGGICFRDNGSISIHNNDTDREESIPGIAEKLHWLISSHFNLFELIESGVAIDAKTLTNKI